MFEKLSVRSTGNLQSPLDLGSLVEVAVFYGHVDVLIDPGNIKQIVRTWSADGLTALLDSGIFTFRHFENMAGIRTDNIGTTRERYDVIVFQLLTHARTPAPPDVLLGRAIEQALGRRGKARRLTNRLCRSLVLSRLNPDFAERVRTDLLDTEFVQRALSEVLSRQFGLSHRLANPTFELRRGADGLVLATDLDFDALNAAHRQRTGSSESITPAALLTRFISVRQLLEDAALSSADIHADPIDSLILGTRVETIIRRTTKNKEQIAQFQDLVLDDGRSIRTAVNSGQVTLRDIFVLIENAQRFRHWLQDKDPDAGLVKEYFRETIANTWADKLPSKTFRWAVFTGTGLLLDGAGLGGLGTTIGIGVSALDSFLIDSLLRGWKPNQFVEATLKPFTDKAP